jgi:hypothetical protein
MRIRGVMLGLVASAGLVAVAGIGLRAGMLAGPAAIAALLSLAGYAAAGRDAPGRVRWPVLAAAVLLTAAAVGVTVWLARAAHGNADLAGPSASTPDGSAGPDARDLLRDNEADLAHVRWIAAGLLLPAVGFAVAALTAGLRPAGRRGKRLPAATASVGALLLAVLAVRGLSLASEDWAGTGTTTARRVVDLTGAVWLAVLAAAVSIAAAVLAARRTGAAGWFGATGGLLFAAPAFALASVAMDTVFTRWLLEPGDGSWLQPGVRYGVAAPMLREPAVDLSGSLIAAAFLTGAALLAAGLLRTSARSVP